MATTPRSPYQAAARQLLRTTLLETARELLRERRWNDITMADIATGAGVSRQTLYNEFGSRDGFVQAYLLYDADRILSAVEHAIETSGGEPADALERAFLVFLEMIAGDPLAVTVISGDDPDGLLALVTTRGGPVLRIAAGRLATAILRMWPEAANADVQLLSETLVRMALSHATLPDGDPADTAASISTLLTPFAETALLRAAVDAG
jgi:AcrR family transcriptional regulator